MLADLARAEVRDTLRRIWLEPDSLDPSRVSARVTRQVASQLADLARSLERSGHKPDHVATFLTRALFSMFAEDVGLLPKGAFLQLLQTHRKQPVTLQQLLRVLWADMDRGEFSAALAIQVTRLNSARCWSARSTRPSAMPSARTTRRVPMSNGWCCPP